jgi:hypothetical protein
MWTGLFAALLLAVATAASGCATRGAPYRFSSPMLGQADVPPDQLPGARPHDRGRARGTRERPIATTKGRAAPTRKSSGWQADAQSAIRTASARGIEPRPPSSASADAASSLTREGLGASALLHEGGSRGPAFTRLPDPHRPARGPVARATDLPQLARIREPSDLRALVGTRDKREPFAIVTRWLADLGIKFVESAPPVAMAHAAARVPGEPLALVAWAHARNRLRPPTDAPEAGDVLVFDRTISDRPADLVGIVIGRDARGVTEFVYAGGGVIRRGFVDPTRPSVRRDMTGAVVNTFLRHAALWPPKGTRYLAGELLAHVLRTR